MQDTKNHLATLEHTNISVSNPDKTAQLLCDLFSWKIRWAGPSMNDGHTVHVGTEESYLALYTNPKIQSGEQSDPASQNHLNHIGVVVTDLKSMEQRAITLGLMPNNFRDYRLCKSFYVVEESGLEIEIISYD